MKQIEIIPDPSSYERCKHTEIRIPILKPEQPAATGVRVIFTDGGQYPQYHGPVGVIDLTSRKLVRKIGVGASPDGVGYGPTPR